MAIRAKLILFLLTGLIGFTCLTGLGVWQIHRRAWKLDLIEQVEQRVHAAPSPLPGPTEWPAINAAHDAYRRVQAEGFYLNDKETLIQASTMRGSGYWVVTPFQAKNGFIVLVNRGFVPPEARAPETRKAGQITGDTTVTGLLRITEPKGRILRANDPTAGRWYSCDVAAIAAAQNLQNPAPYFIDADATPNPGGLPVGGLTMIAFPNNHLVYALTWFGLALMLAGTMAAALISEYNSNNRPLL